uniref:Uncharacterized protein n=1 Tax=Lactuca sativa TaxID=4236 RepID=A0A9R1WMF8_LACSA|nr:hypothetical protein LSAT_V11C100017670 [Lactuca sativa]
MYKYKVQPINGRSMWPKSDFPITLTPPKHTKQVGRPKKKRKRAQTEEPNNQVCILFLNISNVVMALQWSKAYKNLSLSYFIL